MLDNQFILEVKYLDSIKRVKKKTIVGVYPNLEAVEKIKQKLLTDETKYTLAFSVVANYNPFINVAS